MNSWSRLGTFVKPTALEGWAEVDARIGQLHKAGGHCRMRNIARVLKDAGKPVWLANRCLQYKCPTCEKMKLGDQLIPKTSTYEIPQAWEAVSADVAEVLCPGQAVKIKFVLYIDIATKLAVTEVLYAYPATQSRAESAEVLCSSFARSW